MNTTPAPGSGSNPRPAMPDLDIFGMEIKEMTIAEQKQCLQHEIDKLEAIENSDTEVSEVAVVEEDDGYPFKIGYQVSLLPSLHGFSSVENFREELVTKLEDFLNQKGKEGWILCTIQQGHAIFMRLDPNEEILK